MCKGLFLTMYMFWGTYPKAACYFSHGCLPFFGHPPTLVCSKNAGGGGGVTPFLMAVVAGVLPHDTGTMQVTQLPAVILLEGGGPAGHSLSKRMPHGDSSDLALGLRNRIRATPKHDWRIIFELICGQDSCSYMQWWNPGLCDHHQSSRWLAQHAVHEARQGSETSRSSIFHERR